jgi:hypothetical protein
LVPVGAVGLFFVLRECRQALPPADTSAAPAVTLPATPDAPAPADPAPMPAEATPAPAPAPQ